MTVFDDTVIDFFDLELIAGKPNVVTLVKRHPNQIIAAWVVGNCSDFSNYLKSKVAFAQWVYGLLFCT